MTDFKSLIFAEYQQNLNKNNKTLVIDVDGVVASIVEDGNYSNAQPIKANINYINTLKKAGLKIIFYTARGSVSGINWEKITNDQFKEWGLLFDELKFGKPAADLYIDDKAATPSILHQLAKTIKKVSENNS